MHRNSGQPIGQTGDPIRLGEYDVYSLGSIRISGEPLVMRLYSHSIPGRDNSFCDGVRARDGKCVIPGLMNHRASGGNWVRFQACHVFPLEKESLWVEHNYGQWITDMDDGAGVTKIDSVRNGLLMRADLRLGFDNYSFSINPDDGYKITVFLADNFGIDGRILDPVCRYTANSHRVSDELLSWHFRQAVLANMRGAGEPIFEHDFPTGTDMLTEIRAETYGKERFEMELEARLRAQRLSDQATIM